MINHVKCPFCQQNVTKIDTVVPGKKEKSD